MGAGQHIILEVVVSWNAERENASNVYNLFNISSQWQKQGSDKLHLYALLY